MDNYVGISVLLHVTYIFALKIKKYELKEKYIIILHRKNI